MPRKARITTPVGLVPEKTSYSTLEAADLLGVSFQTVARWMDRGYLRGWRTPGGHRYINAASLEEMLQKGRAPVVAEAAPEGGRQMADDALRILLVDDSADDLALLRATLLAVVPGAEVVSVDNAFAALMAIGKAPPDLLITDIMMPDVDGLEMIRNLRAGEQTASISVIVVSSYREKALVQRFGPLPEDVKFLNKPVKADALQPLLAAVIPRQT
jgi:excisionase family DNA binding protein